MDVSPPAPAPSTAAREACAAWFGPAVVEVGPPPGVGFSGAPLVRVRPRGGGAWFVLKAFAGGTPRGRAEWVHALIRHLHAAGVGEVPRPLETAAGGTLATDDHGIHWELVPVVAGGPVAAPSVAQAAAALAVLARIHAAAAEWPESPPQVGPSPGLTRRREQARMLQQRPWHARRAAIDATADLAAVVARWDRAIADFDATEGRRAVAVVAAARADAVPLQAVLRDVWSAHVLFASGASPHVAGIVDVHAAAVDAPATDIARLLGSWRGAPTACDPVAAWPDAVAAYAAVRPLAAAERRQVSILHAAGVICGLDNWFRWTCEERRTFAAPAAVLARVDRLLDQLPAALAWLAAEGGLCV
jgi:Ser/Thr protein kinase RdoA (MazF antagonist)